MIGKNKKLASRVYSILEVNCDFNIFEDNVFVAESANNF